MILNDLKVFMHGKEVAVDIGIIGGGVTGLMLLKKLSELDISVALLDKSDKLANGPSTRNEGWLHRGTYHSQSILDRKTAIQVAKRCIYGHEQIKSYAPEAVEGGVHTTAYALIKSPDRVAEVVSRWDEAEVIYKGVLLRELAKTNPEVRTSNFVEAFQVADVGINTRMLYRKLMADGKRAGAQIYTGIDAAFRSTNEVDAFREGEKVASISAKVYVHTSGYGMREFFRKNFNINIPTRFWKSHLLVVPRLTHDDIFCLDSGESGMMNHGEYTIVGANEDAVLLDNPDFDLIPDRVENVKQAMERLFFLDRDMLHKPVACLKVDIPEVTSEARSLNIKVAEPLPGHVCVLPGKMTESPYVTDIVTKMLYHRLDDTSIAERPCDIWKKER